MTYQPDLVIYHDNCDDGYAAAMVCYMRWPKVKFLATNYGRNDVSPHHFKNKHVLITDFSFSAADLMKMAESALSVLVLDHHKSAKEALSGLPHVERPNSDGWVDYMHDCLEANRPVLGVEFDMERSGARMTWDFCFPDEDAPMFIKLIEDRDLWKFKYSLSKGFTAYLRSIPRNFTDWIAILETLEKYPEHIKAKAEAVLAYKSELISRIVDTTEVRTFGKWEGVAVTETCPYELVSDVCNEMLRRNPDAPFAVALIRSKGGLTFSFRSEDSRIDVSEIAKSFGGGGHRNAAGARFPM